MKWLIREYMARKHIEGYIELSKLTGIKLTTLKDRLKNPQNLKGFEFAALNEVLGFSEEDILQIFNFLRGET